MAHRRSARAARRRWPGPGRCRSGTTPSVTPETVTAARGRASGHRDLGRHDDAAAQVRKHGSGFCLAGGRRPAHDPSGGQGLGRGRLGHLAGVLVDGELDHGQDEQQEQRSGHDQLGAATVVMADPSPRAPTSARGHRSGGFPHPHPRLMELALARTLAVMMATAAESQGHQQGGDHHRFGRVATVGLRLELRPAFPAAFGPWPRSPRVRRTRFLLSIHLRDHGTTSPSGRHGLRVSAQTPATTWAMAG